MLSLHNAEMITENHQQGQIGAPSCAKVSSAIYSEAPNMNAVSQDTFSSLHIDIARNSTDDFNLFHDSKRWRRISGNPFNGQILLAFQIESLIEGKVAEFRRLHEEEKLIAEHGLHFSNYQFTFCQCHQTRSVGRGRDQRIPVHSRAYADIE